MAWCLVKHRDNFVSFLHYIVLFFCVILSEFLSPVPHFHFPFFFSFLSLFPFLLRPSSFVFPLFLFLFISLHSFFSLSFYHSLFLPSKHFLSSLKNSFQMPCFLDIPFHVFQLVTGGLLVMAMYVVSSFEYLQGDSKLLSEFPWPIIFKPEITKQNCLWNMKA
jgi:hypothetical protein